MAGAISRARLIDSVHTLAARPYTVLFASCTASGGVRKLMATSTGPKISACATAAEVDAPVIRVGGNHEPSAGNSHAGCHTLQPSARAESTSAALRWRCTGSTSAPTSIDLSSGEPKI